MQRSGAIIRSAWTERSLAVVALSAALLAAVGGAAGVLWLFQDLADQLWITLAVAAVVFVAAQAVISTAGRRRRRDHWSAERAGFSRGTQLTLAEQALDQRPETALPDLSHHTDLMTDLLTEIELMQEQLTELVSQVHGESRSSGSGRHARPVLVDVRTDEDILESGTFEDDAELDDFEDEPYGVGNVLRISDRIDLDAAARGRRVPAGRDDEDEDEDDLHTVVDLSAHGTEDPLVTDEDDADDEDDPEGGTTTTAGWFDEDPTGGDESDEDVGTAERTRSTRPAPTAPVDTVEAVDRRERRDTP